MNETDTAQDETLEHFLARRNLVGCRCEWRRTRTGTWRMAKYNFRCPKWHGQSLRPAQRGGERDEQ
jgi:hypothetical protein